MMPTAQVRLSTAVWLVLIVSACGGGGGGRKVASAAPPPTSPPTPPPTPSAVELFENAATQEFAALSSGRDRRPDSDSLRRCDENI